MAKKSYIKSELPQETIEELFLEIIGKNVLPKREMHRLDAFFTKDKNGDISLYFYNSENEPTNKIKNGYHKA